MFDGNTCIWLAHFSVAMKGMHAAHKWIGPVVGTISHTMKKDNVGNYTTRLIFITSKLIDRQTDTVCIECGYDE